MHVYILCLNFSLTAKKKPLALKRFDISRTVMSSLTLWQLMLRLSRYTHTVTAQLLRHRHTHRYACCAAGRCQGTHHYSFLNNIPCTHIHTQAHLHRCINVHIVLKVHIHKYVGI